MPVTSFTASVAWIIATRPGSTPSTPPSAQEGTAPGGGRLGEEAAVAGPLARVEHRGICPSKRNIEPCTLGMPEERAGVIAEVAGGEVVGAVDDDVVATLRISMRVAGVEHHGRSRSTWTSGFIAATRSRRHVESSDDRRPSLP